LGKVVGRRKQKEGSRKRKREEEVSKERKGPGDRRSKLQMEP